MYTVKIYEKIILVTKDGVDGSVSFMRDDIWTIKELIEEFEKTLLYKEEE